MTALGSMRARIIAFACVVVLVVGLGVGYVAATSAEQAEKRRPTSGTVTDRALPLSQVLAGPHLAFRSTSNGPTYGRLAVVPLTNPTGNRATTDQDCDRVYAAGTGAVCVTADRGVLTTYQLSTLGPDLRPTATTDLKGLPSRVRMSSDGALAATTMFVSGHSYAGDNFSTETTIHDARRGKSLGNVEKWRILVDGKRSRAPSLNVWGVSFVPGPAADAFYATVAIGSRTWLAKGSVARRELRTVHTSVECPSVSPDGTRVAFKKRSTGSGSRTWRITVLNLRTGTETPLAETRSVDDQPEWLDNTRMLYGMERAGSAESDVWVVPANGGGRPQIFLPRAWSPSVVSRAAAG